MEPLLTYRGTVYPWNCDHMGHMNVQFYVAKFDQATWNLMGELGLTTAYFKENQCGMVAVDQHITYSRELLPGDNLYVESVILEVGNKKIRFRHDMFHAESKELAAQTTLVGVHLNTATRKAQSLPGFVSQAKILGEFN